MPISRLERTLGEHLTEELFSSVNPFYICHFSKFVKLFFKWQPARSMRSLAQIGNTTKRVSLVIRRSKQAETQMECLFEIACTRPAFISYMTTQQTDVTVWAISTAKVEVF